MDSSPEEIKEFCREVDAFLASFDLKGHTTFIQKLGHVLKKAATGEYITNAMLGSPLGMVKPGIDLAAYLVQGTQIMVKANQLGRTYPKEFSLWVDEISDTGEIYCGHWNNHTSFFPWKNK